MGNEQHAMAFWDHITFHYLEHMPSWGRRGRGGTACVIFGNKMGVDKIDIAKYVGSYGQMLVMKELKVKLQDALEHALEFYKLKHACFTFFTTS